jgi:H+-transporting ATPase
METVVSETPGEKIVEGLSSQEAQARLDRYGPNAIPEEKKSTWLIILEKLWGPVPWMLEVSVILEVLLKKHEEAIVIAALILFNAAISAFQERRAQNALALLREKLSLYARALRDGQWQKIAVRELVPGDVIYLRMGDVIPADVRLLTGGVLIDQSALTGESVAKDAGPGDVAFAGTIIRQGESEAVVTATGTATKFGKTAELVRLAKTRGHLQEVVFAVVKNLVAMDAVLVAAILVYSALAHLSFGDVIPFALILLVASVPVALPATFTLATALGSVELVRHGVLVTRLAAIEEAASMDVLCTDKTGTITENRMTVAEIHSYSSYTQEDVLHYGALACDTATQDPIDLAVLSAAKERNGAAAEGQRISFTPFSPATKRTEAIFATPASRLRVVKGAPQVIQPLCGPNQAPIESDVDLLASRGYRVIAVAVGDDQQLNMVGLIALQDPPRSDSSWLIGRLKDMGVRVLMITGDGESTARAIAEQVGIQGKVCNAEKLTHAETDLDPECGVYAEVLPEHKFKLVRIFQSARHIVGMTGDGVNDAPALKQAEVGIAVSSSTDVAKAAASLVLTSPGLSNIVNAVEVSRRIYQRMLTYTLNKIVKTIEIAFFLSLGLILTHTFVTTPLLMVLLLFTNDFATMSIASDRAVTSAKPNQWKVGSLVIGALTLALPILILSFTIFLTGRDYLKLPLAQLQTLLFVMLVFSGQGTIYLVRERRHFWNSLPSRYLLLSSGLDILIVTLLAWRGILMAAIPLHLILALGAVILAYLFLLDFIKIKVFEKLQIHQ